MLSYAGLDKEFWAEAVSYAGHLINRLPAAANEGKTPMEVWSGKPATDYHYLHIFGCPAYFHVRESKLDTRAKKAVFLGFNDGVKGFRLWCPDVKKVVVSRDVTFDEAVMVNQNKQKDYQEQRMTIESFKRVEFKENGDEALVDPVSPTVDSDDSINEDMSIEADAPTQEPTRQGGPIATTKTKETLESQLG